STASIPELVTRPKRLGYADLRPNPSDFVPRGDGAACGQIITPTFEVRHTPRALRSAQPCASPRRCLSLVTGTERGWHSPVQGRTGLVRAGYAVLRSAWRGWRRCGRRFVSLTISSR